MPPRWVAPVALAGAVGVLAYILAWAIAGLLWSGYDPIRQAISELFAAGAPATPRTLLSAALVASGVALITFGPALHRGLPGRGLAGPVLAVVSGVFTILAVVFPCSDGCPGAGSSFTDAAHTWVAGIGYVCLILAPLAVGWRIRPWLPRFARWSFLLGGVALVGFMLRIGVLDVYGGLQQRLFNTTADAWYLLAAAVLYRRARAPRREP